MLLRVGVQGVEAEAEKIRRLEAKIGKATPLKAKTDEELDRIINDKRRKMKIEKVGETGKRISFEMSDKAVAMIMRAIRGFADINAQLTYDLHNVLCVYAWSAFEGYVQAVLWDLFYRNPELLSQDKTISYRQVVEGRNDIIRTLIREEIDSVGRKSFQDLNIYLGTRLKAQIASRFSDELHGIYFLRNIIAHSAGQMREEQLAMVPDGADAVERQLQLSSEYLEGAIKCIEEAVTSLDKRLYELYFSDDAQADKPKAIETPSMDSVTTGTSNSTGGA